MIKNQSLTNPEFVVPICAYPTVANPTVANPTVANPTVANPGVVNPGVVAPGASSIASHLRKWMGDDKGSAIVEFVVLAIPLFIPVFIYLASFASLSGNEAIVRTLARETLRAYVVSENDHAGREVSVQALAVIATNLGLSDGERQSLSTRFECSENPCLSANGRIRLTISFIDSRSHRRIEASAQEHISPWM